MNSQFKTRKEAKASGSRFYFTGVACPQGHTANRYTSSSGCSKCVWKHKKECVAAARKRIVAKRKADGLCRCGRSKPESGNRCCQLCLDEYRAYNQQVKREAIDAYGGKCVCCGETHIDFLTIDHGNNDGAAHRKEVGINHRMYLALKRAGFPQDRNLRAMCWNCQWGRRISGVCVHQQVRKAVGV